MNSVKLVIISNCLALPLLAIMARRQRKWCPSTLEWLLRFKNIANIFTTVFKPWDVRFHLLESFVKVFGSYMPLMKPPLWKFGFYCQILINLVCNTNSFTFKVKIKSNMVDVSVDMREKSSVMFYCTFFLLGLDIFVDWVKAFHQTYLNYYSSLFMM